VPETVIGYVVLESAQYCVVIGVFDGPFTTVELCAVDAVGVPGVPVALDPLPVAEIIADVGVAPVELELKYATVIGFAELITGVVAEIAIAELVLLKLNALEAAASSYEPTDEMVMP